MRESDYSKIIHFPSMPGRRVGGVVRNSAVLRKLLVEI